MCSQKCGEFLFKRRNFLPQNIPSAFQYALNGLADFRFVGQVVRLGIVLEDHVTAAVLQITSQMFAIKGQGPSQSIFQGHAWLPAEGGFDEAEVRIIVTNVDPLALSRERSRDKFPAAVNADKQLGEVMQTNGSLATEVENLTVARFIRRRKQQRIDR